MTKHIIISKHVGRCVACRQRYSPGDPVIKISAHQYSHPECIQVARHIAPDSEPVFAVDMDDYETRDHTFSYNDRPASAISRITRYL